MNSNRAVLTAVVVVVVLILGWLLFGRGGSGDGVDLLARFEGAQRCTPPASPDVSCVSPDPALFSVVDATLQNETQRAIAITPTVGTRIIWRVQVPDDGWLRVSLGMQPESWVKEGDGVKFLVGVSDGGAFDTLFEQHLHPFANEADRKWIPLTVDLSTYAGETVDLIFNTYSHLPGQPEDHRNDLPLWGNPEIVVR
ncbi:MAG: hypothetical protein H0U94_12495 [Acidobacteria bacterium]|jgi:hypothetical protein|nr:hypothetical protein [Acidobacteriota bacterium]